MPTQRKVLTFRDGPYKSSRQRQQITWGTLGESSLHSFVQKMTDLSYTVCLGRTADGSALSLTVLAGDQKIKEYIHPGDDVLNILQSIMDYCEA